MTNSTVKSIHTCCKQCVFAKYENNTQTNCLLDYIDKYRNKNIEILEAYDEEKEFYIINDKKCIGYRENKWFDRYDLSDDSIETKIALYHQYNKIDYLVVVNLQQFDVISLDRMFSELCNNKTQPQKIILVRYKDEKLSFNYSAIESVIKKYNISYPWRIQTMLDNSISYEAVLHNITAINQKYRFILSLSAPTETFSYLIDEANRIVHKDLDQFTVLSNPAKTAIMYSGAVYRFGIVHNQNILQEDSKYTIL